MIMDVQIYSCFNSFACIPEVELLNYMVIVVLIFWGTDTDCVILHSQQWFTRVPVSTFLPPFVFHFFKSSRSNGYDVVSHCSFEICILLVVALILFSMCLLTIYVSFLEKCLFKPFVFLNWIICSFFVVNEFQKLPILFVFRICFMICKYFSLSVHTFFILSILSFDAHI